MSADCLFCRIAAREIPAHVIHEDAEVMAFLDLHPIRPGHVLVIPKAHFEWFEDMPERQANAVMACAQRVARALKAHYGVERVAMFFTGIHVPHAHAHVVPMHHVHDVTSGAYLEEGREAFTVPPQLPQAEMERIAGELRARL
jgi:histidine triad (HIT) family protein